MKFPGSEHEKNDKTIEQESYFRQAIESFMIDEASVVNGLLPKE